VSRIATRFTALRAEGRGGLVAYLTAGDPDLDTSMRLFSGLAPTGADLIEIGMPFSDPMADGPVIQEASYRALAGGTRVADVLHTVQAVAATGVPVLVMTYWNPVDRYGVRAFARDLAAAGGSGLITPDLPPEEAGPWLDASDENDLDRVFLAAPSSTDQRIAKVASACRGFVYAASLMGITGTREAVGAQAEDLVQRIRPHTDLPVAVGLGVSNVAQAAQVAAFADGAIVGSAFVRRLLDAADTSGGVAGTPAAGTDAVAELAAELSAALRRARS